METYVPYALEGSPFYIISFYWGWHFSWEPFLA